LLMGKRVWLSTGLITMDGGVAALAIWGMPRMLRDILSATITKSCDSTPVPATNPCSSAFMCVTGTPEGFFTPLEAQPAANTAIITPQTDAVIRVITIFIS